MPESSNSLSHSSLHAQQNPPRSCEHSAAAAGHANGPVRPSRVVVILVLAFAMLIR